MFENIIYSDYGSTCCKTFFSKIEIVGTTCTHETYRVGHAMDMPAPKKWPGVWSKEIHRVTFETDGHVHVCVEKVGGSVRVADTANLEFI